MPKSRNRPNPHSTQRRSRSAESSSPRMPERLIGVNLLDLHLVVVAGTGSAPGGSFELTRPTFFGTAFPILPGLFVTASHVVKAAREAGGDLALYRTRIDGTAAAPVQVVNDCELFDGLDLAIMECRGHRDLLPLPLLFEPLKVLTPVKAVGFATGIDVEYHRFVHRAFAGHVVTRRELFHLKPDQLRDTNCHSWPLRACPDRLSWSAPAMANSQSGTSFIPGMLSWREWSTDSGLPLRPRHCSASGVALSVGLWPRRSAGNRACSGRRLYRCRRRGLVRPLPLQYGRREEIVGPRFRA